jgi:hypothetical protein
MRRRCEGYGHDRLHITKGIVQSLVSDNRFSANKVAFRIKNINVGGGQRKKGRQFSLAAMLIGAPHMKNYIRHKTILQGA